MGIGKDIFIKPVPLDLVCNICSEVLCEPVQVHCGEDHIFCHQCILPLVDSKQSNDIPCPTCNMPMNANTLQPSKFVQRQLGRLAIRCQYHASGCPWTGTLSSDHISHCTFKSRVCVNAEHGCTHQSDDTTMAQHELLCDYGVMECPNGACTSTHYRKDSAQHQSTCRSYPCLYATSGCPYIGTVPEVNNHCAIYCGRLHDRIQQLEQECFLLNKQLELKNVLQQQSPDHTHTTTTTTTITSTTGSSSTDYTYPSSSTNPLANTIPLQPMNEETIGDPLLQMVCDTDIFKLMESASTNDMASSTSSITNSHNTSIITSPLPVSQQQQQRNAPVSTTKITSSPISSGPPKRTPRGKRIRYSKNTKLAHTALRASKSVTTLPTTPGEDEPTVDYSAPSSSSALSPQTAADSPASAGTPGSEDLSRLMDTLSTTSPHAHSPLSFNTLDDVAKFFDTLPPPSRLPQQKKKTTTPSTTSNPPAQKPNPMFVLASSYLSNYK
ncbi:hypothetical protein [Absidia glauca]|uniref:RING-type domain-containing protein n=1 Tax=Absidia glauca TaxID=4829 RepID=A0A163J5Z0_ABSGL|nr:hypothetical protein [Absidia glauca]